MKYRHFWIILLAIFAIGCAETELQQQILTARIDDEPTVQTELPDALLSVMHDQIEWRFLNYWTRAQEDEALQKKWKEHFGEKPLEVIIQEQQAQQKAYYNRYIDAEGMAIVGNEVIEDKHFITARRIALIMTAKHPKLREAMQVRRKNTHGSQIGFYQVLFNNSPHYGYAGETPEDYLINRFTGRTTAFNYGTCYITQKQGELKSITICKSPIDAYNHRLRTFTHELAHRIHGMWRSTMDKDFNDKLEHAFKVAREEGVPLAWARNTYHEYWAEGVEAWFYDIHSESTAWKTYKDFQEEQPLLFDLLSEVFIPAHFGSFDSGFGWLGQ